MEFSRFSDFQKMEFFRISENQNFQKTEFPTFSEFPENGKLPNHHQPSNFQTS